MFCFFINVFRFFNTVDKVEKVPHVYKVNKVHTFVKANELTLYTL